MTSIPPLALEAVRKSDGGVSLERTRSLVGLLVAVRVQDGDAAKAAVDSCRIAGCTRLALEETLLQAVLFFGFPRVVVAFGVLEDAWPPSDEELHARPVPIPADEHGGRGRRLFGDVYGDKADRVLGKLHGFHPEFAAFVVESAYGRILARPGLETVERELLACAALTLLRQPEQLLSHVLGAVRCGAAPEDVLQIIAAAGGDEGLRSSIAERL